MPKNPLGDFLRHYAVEGHGKANQWGDGPWIFYTFDHRCLKNAEDYDGLAITVPRGAADVKAIEDEFFRYHDDVRRRAMISTNAQPSGDYLPRWQQSHRALPVTAGKSEVL